MDSFLEDEFSLKGKTAVIIGGAGVLGFSIAKGLGKAGAKIAIASQKNYNIAAKDLLSEGIEAKGYQVNVMEKEEVLKCSEKILTDFKEVSILVNCVGGNLKEATTSSELSFFDLSCSDIEKVVSLNLFGGAILPSQMFGRHMIKNKNGGSIINISSMNSFRPLTRIPGYSSAKAAVSNFTQWLAVHFAQEYNKNIRVNAIAPGFFLTRQNKYLLLDEKENLTERGHTIISHTPMGRFGEPDDLVGICIFLASDSSIFVTGTVIPIDGGFNAFSGV